MNVPLSLGLLRLGLLLVLLPSLRTDALVAPDKVILAPIKYVDNRGYSADRGTGLDDKAEISTLYGKFKLHLANHAGSGRKTKANTGFSLGTFRSGQKDDLVESEYFYSTVRRSHGNATEFCQSKLPGYGWSLVSLHSAAEREFVLSQGTAASFG